MIEHSQIYFKHTQIYLKDGQSQIERYKIEKQKEKKSVIQIDIKIER